MVTNTWNSYCVNSKSSDDLQYYMGLLEQYRLKVVKGLAKLYK